jgi:predicted AAA+ superfamily ATPase
LKIERYPLGFHGNVVLVIERPAQIAAIESLLRQFPVVAILGARQVGKTTLARELVARRRGPTTTFDLESAEDLSLLADPLLALRPVSGLVVIDEVQRQPGLFSTLRVLVDDPRARRRFLVLGSASPDLLRQTSESLAGRIAYHELDGFSPEEVGSRHASRLWCRGGFPRSFLARSDTASLAWRRELIRTYLERDIPALGLRLPAPALRRFWMMLAHYHGRIWNASEFARSFGVAHTTVQRYLDVLTATFVVRQLRPWHENIAKRQVKAPKVYLRDSGLLHALLGLATARDVASHPVVGASWEGFALDTVVLRLGARPEECYFWATHSGAKLDLLVVRGRRRLGFEFKRSATPRATRSMRTAMEVLGLSELCVIHAGQGTGPLASGIRAVAFDRLALDLKPLRL